MLRLEEIASYIRSKNAGPFTLTIELFFDSDEAYERVKRSGEVNAALVAKLYGVEEATVKSFYLDNIRIIKFSYPRPHPAGDRYENDMHAGQQYIRIAEYCLQEGGTQ